MPTTYNSGGVYTDPAAPAANDTVTISNGSTLVINNGNWSANGVGNIALSDGQIRVLNSSTTTGYRFLLYQYSTTFQINASSRGSIEILGNWINIPSSGFGSAGATAQHWDTTGDYIPCVWIETAQGSGVYEKYLNMTGIVAAHTVGMARVGTGKYGKFFTQHFGTVTTTGNATVTGTGTKFTKLTVGHKLNIALNTYTIQSIESDTSLTLTGNAAAVTNSSQWTSSVIWFGDGTNGKIPPANAIIRVPNIIVTYSLALNALAPTISPANGAVTLDTVQMSRFTISAPTGSRRVRAYRSSLLGGGVWGSAFDTLFEDCGWANNKVETTSLLVSNSVSAPMTNWVFRNCSGWSGPTGSANPTLSFQASQMVFEDCEFYQIFNSNLSNTTLYVLGSDNLCDIQIIRGTWCGMLQTSGAFESTDTEFIDNPRMVETDTYGSRSCFAVGQTGGILSKFKLTNPYVPNGGGCQQFINILANTTVNNLDIRGLNVESSYYQYFFQGNSTQYHTNWFMADWDVAGLRSGLLFTNSLSNFRVLGGTIQNIRCDSYSNILGTMHGAGPQNLIARSVAMTNNPNTSTGGAAYDNWFYSIQTAETTGAFGTVFTMPTEKTQAIVQLSGPGAAIQGQQLFLTKTGDYCIVECPWKVLGVSGFTAVRTGMPAAIATYYNIDTGSGFRSTGGPNSDGWYAVSNLPSETVSATEGFRFKLKFVSTADVSGVTNNITYWGVTTTFDETVQYPQATATLKLTGLKAGSEIRVYAGESELAGAESSSDTFEYIYDYTGDISASVVIHHLNYQFLRYDGLTLTASGLTLPIQQQRDRNYLNP
jgi:hypothetical protein